jgi:hypothetical protein
MMNVRKEDASTYVQARSSLGIPDMLSSRTKAFVALHKTEFLFSLLPGSWSASL